MMNIFSSFDPTTSNLTSMNWIIIMMIILMIPNSYWLIISRKTMLWTILLTKLNKELKIMLMENKNSSLLLISMFTLIMLSNMSSMFPYIFPSTSNMSINLSLALPLWMSMMMFGWTKFTMNMLIHLVPMGTPKILIPFMVCIETISNIIRPGTLTIRLTANITAGHLMMTLLGSSNFNYSLYTIWISIIIQLMLMSLEFMVSIIQAYVFTTLLTLYSSEIS
uniref:ATP synthase subunit a n=1 Tax=Platerodrilus sp. MNCN/DNA:86739 TaxID=1905348 RepID=A0A342Z5E0_9COLE|nr:ATP synthase F0 subunit 6 [Platerodrilus sp. MNCN/DNA:86739]